MPNIPQVTCTRCARKFDTFHDDQAYDCAADLRSDRTIRGHYGSSVADMTTFAFTSSHAWIEAGPLTPGTICDDCIITLRDQGLIEARDGMGTEK